MAQRHGICTAIWNGVQCGAVGALVKHHHFRKSVASKRGKAYQQDACKECHDRSHDRYKGSAGGPDDKWPDDPRFDGISGPFKCGDNP